MNAINKINDAENILYAANGFVFRANKLDDTPHGHYIPILGYHIKMNVADEISKNTKYLHGQIGSMLMLAS